MCLCVFNPADKFRKLYKEHTTTSYMIFEIMVIILTYLVCFGIGYTWGSYNGTR